MLFSTHVNLLWAVTALFCVVAQSNLQETNATICNWAQARSGVIRDTVYLDGGEMWWKVGFADGNTNLVTNDGNAEGEMYYLNFSMPFNTQTTNLTALFQSLQKAGGAANNIAPNYVDGMMFANDDELLLYGGLIRLTNAYSPPPADAVLAYEEYQYGPALQSFSPGFVESNLPAGVTRYVTNGAGVNVPSENLGFYFSGMCGQNWGPIEGDDASANQSANTLIEVDMSVMRKENFTNHTLPNSVSPRANAALVWVPVSQQGVLVAIGGVSSPEEIFPQGLNSSQTAFSQSNSPSFMTSLPVYDIAGQSWYTQNTSGTPPPQLTEFCAVTASASDDSSFNVYIYGGYDGLNAVDPPSDDVWVLSIPSFIWTKVYSGNSSHGRSGHVCVTPYPDQMFIIGGIHQDPTQCVDGGIIQVFNLNTLQFQESYDPTVWSTYKVPSAISSVIGGNEKGGSTKSASWSSNVLGTLFATKYSKSTTHYYPYPSNTTLSTSDNSTSPAAATSPSPKHPSSFPKWAIILLAVLLSLLLLLALLLAWILLRRRRLVRANNSNAVPSRSSTSASTNPTSNVRNSNRIMRWANGMSEIQPPKTASSVYSTSLETSEHRSSNPPTTNTTANTAEIEGSQRFELHGNTTQDQQALLQAPVEMPTPYNNGRVFGTQNLGDNETGSGSAGVGVARGSSLFHEDEQVSPVQMRGVSNRHTLNRGGIGTGGTESSSEGSRKVSPYVSGTGTEGEGSRVSAGRERDREPEAWPLVSPISDEATFQRLR